jgi:hypothetical protein
VTKETAGLYSDPKANCAKKLLFLKQKKVTLYSTSLADFHDAMGLVALMALVQFYKHG